MEKSSRELLEEVITELLSNLEDAEIGEDRNDAVNNLVSLYKLKIEEEKLDVDSDDRYYRRQSEDEDRKEDLRLKQEDLNVKQSQLNEQKIDRIVNAAMMLGTTLIGVFAYNSWYRTGLEFEKTGTFTSPMMRNLLSKMLPGKK